MNEAAEMRQGRRAGETRAAGFTLIELLVVLVILGLLATIAVPQVLNYLGGAKTDTAKLQIQGLENALDLYRLEVGRYPTQQEGLMALVDRPAAAARWSGPYVKRKEMLNDPWGRPFIYRIPGEHGDYDLYTLGADGSGSGGGENQIVSNW